MTDQRPGEARARHEGCVSHRTSTCAWLRDGTKIAIRREGAQAGLEHLQQDMLSLQGECSPEAGPCAVCGGAAERRVDGLGWLCSATCENLARERPRSSDAVRSRAEERARRFFTTEIGQVPTAGSCHLHVDGKAFFDALVEAFTQADHRTEPDSLLTKAVGYLNRWHLEDDALPWDESHDEVKALVELFRPARAQRTEPAGPTTGPYEACPGCSVALCCARCGEPVPRRESASPEHPEARAIRLLAAQFEELGKEPCESCGWALNEIRDFVHIVLAARAWRKNKRKGFNGGDLTADRLIDAVDAAQSSGTPKEGP